MAGAKVKKTTKIAELFQRYPQAAEFLFQRGLHCFGCALARFETIEEGARAHGLTEKEVNQLVDEINQLVENSKKKDPHQKINQGTED